jgi:hypothetical protein
VGQVLRLDNEVYVLAQADTEANAEVIGMVSEVADADNFTIINVGHVGPTIEDDQGDPLDPDNVVYYLSATVAGGITATQPSTVGQVSKPVFWPDSTDEGFFSFTMRGFVVTAAGGPVYEEITVTADLTWAAGWGDLGGTYTVVTLRRYAALKQVHIFGTANPSTSVPVDAFTLPVGWRPAAWIGPLFAWNDAALAQFEVKDDGAVSFFAVAGGNALTFNHWIPIP